MIRLDLDVLKQMLAPTGTLYIAYSGGVDSQVLLHSVVQQLPEVRPQVKALHIHHGLSPNADDWAAHCEAVCRQLDVPFLLEQVRIERSGSIEEKARQARYQIFEHHVQEGDVLLQGHHANDQAETLLFRLERGTGLRGLQGIPETRELSKGTLWRPLLAYSRTQIEQYAQLHKLSWVEDESNMDSDYRRNFLRHEVLAPWQASNPTVASQISSSVALVQSEMRVIQRLVGDSLKRLLHSDGSLELRLLVEDEREFWFAKYLNHCDISLTQAQLGAVVAMFFSHDEKQPIYQGKGFRLARYIQRLYVLPEEKAPILGRLEANQWLERDYDKIWSDRALSLQERPSGVRLKLANGMHRPLKKWLQDNGVPSWWREHLPYLFEGEQLVAIGGIWKHPDWQGHIIWQSKGILPTLK